MYERPMFDPGVEIDALKAEIKRLERIIAQMRSQACDSIELAEAEQRGFERGLAHQQSTAGSQK